jgi:uncharacterized membrane protein YjgN (DUF898 family)
MKDQINSLGPDDGKDFVSVLQSKARVRELYRIFIPNLLFSILTLGVFRFWARTRNRRYIFSRMNMLGDGFEYTGTGGEVFKGFLIVFVLVILPFGIIPAYYANSIMMTDPQTAQMINMGQAFLFFLLFPVAIYRAYRYLFSRVSWRGIRFSLVGKTLGYWWRWVAFTMAMPFTLGFIYPKMQTVLMRYLIENGRFGNQRFTFNVRAREVYFEYILSRVAMFILWGLLGAIIISTVSSLGKDRIDAMLTGLTFTEILLFLAGLLGVYLLFGLIYAVIDGIYKAKVFRTFISGSRLEECRFKSDVETRDFIRFNIINTLLMAISFGLAFPVVACRYMSFVAKHLKARNLQNVEQTIQVERDELKQGEGLADALDLGAF